VRVVAEFRLLNHCKKFHTAQIWRPVDIFSYWPSVQFDKAARSRKSSLAAGNTIHIKLRRKIGDECPVGFD